MEAQGTPRTRSRPARDFRASRRLHVSSGAAEFFGLLESVHRARIRCISCDQETWLQGFTVRERAAHFESQLAAGREKSAVH